MSTPKTAILWGRDDVLSRAIELFLSAEEGWEVVTIRDTQIIDQLARAVEALNPKIVIINQGNCNASSKEEIDLPLNLIQKHPGIKVLTISLENNAMEVFNKEKICIKEISDLLSAVEK